MCSYLMLKIKSFVSLKNESFFGQGTFQGGGGGGVKFSRIFSWVAHKGGVV